MKCPFPGFDPYLEHPGLWPGFHNSFIIYLQSILADRLPEGYDADVEEEIRVVEAPPVEAGAYRPDVPVLRDPNAPRRSKTGAVALLDPTAVVPIGEPMLEEVRETRIEIHRWPDNELVTAIEVLSPWNKVGDGFADFQRKRRAVFLTQVNWVEIDLLIGGQRPFFGAPTPDTDYRVVIARGNNRPNAEIYGWNVRDPLPAIPIPLKAPDEPIAVSLAEAFAMTYERSRFDKKVRRLPPGPPSALRREEDRIWAQQIAASR
jgi:hypothetical protein